MNVLHIGNTAAIPKTLRDNLRKDGINSDIMILPFLARMKLRQTRGSSYFQILVNIGVITANIRLFIPNADIIIYILAAFLWVIATTVLGYIDEFYGIWKEELSYGSGAVNPFFFQMSERIENIERIVINEN